MRLIDADALEKSLRDWIRDHWTDAFTGDDAGSEFADVIEHAETIEERTMGLLERAKMLLQATKDLLEKQANSYYALNLLSETVFYDGVECYGIYLKGDIDYWLDELEEQEPCEKERWIPCSKKMPKENEYVDDVCKYYLVQDEYGDMHVAHYTHVGWIPIDSLSALGDNVVAWMPLPEPYNTETEKQMCRDCHYNNGKVHAECILCDKTEMEK